MTAVGVTAVVVAVVVVAAVVAGRRCDRQQQYLSWSKDQCEQSLALHLFVCVSIM
jgi:hypothetical protein